MGYLMSFFWFIFLIVNCFVWYILGFLGFILRFVGIKILKWVFFGFMFWSVLGYIILVRFIFYLLVVKFMVWGNNVLKWVIVFLGKVDIDLLLGRVM